MKGTPYIYQGDELGMTNNGGFRQLSDYRDLESINWFHAYTRAGLTTEAEMFAALGARSRIMRARRCSGMRRQMLVLPRVSHGSW